MLNIILVAGLLLFHFPPMSSSVPLISRCSWDTLNMMPCYPIAAS